MKKVRCEFDLSDLIHLATDSAQCSIFTSLLNGQEQAENL